MGRLAVVYLSRAVNDPRFSWAFFRSLASFPAGVDFDLVLASKGYGRDEIDPSFPAWRSRIACSKVEVARYDDSLSATLVCFDLAKNIAADHVIFFTSWSRILAANWLKYYADAFEKVPDCGIVGATGGYERLNDDTPFPNISVRTNAFMVPTRLFASLDAGNLSAPDGGHLFEAGPNGMTKQIMAHGLVPIVVDRFGRSWRHEEWWKSQTFRMGQQEGLLVADNRTYHFDIASIRKRRRLSQRCWGSAEAIARRPMLRKAVDWYTWNYPRGLHDLGGDLATGAMDTWRRFSGQDAKHPARVFPS